MTLVITAVNEKREGVLLEAGHRAGVEAHGVLVALKQRRRQHHVADAQRGHHGFREGIEVDHLVLGVFGEHRAVAGRHEAELGVVIVLYDPAVFCGVGPFEKGDAPVDGHGGAVGEEVRRRQLDDVHRGLADEIHPEIFLVDGEIAPMVAVVFSNLGEFGRAGVGAGEGEAGAENLHEPAVEVFRPGADDDLLRRDPAHAAVVAQLRGDGFPQHPHALPGDGAHQRVVRGADGLPHAFGPKARGKQLKGGVGRAEIHEPVAVLRGFGRRHGLFAGIGRDVVQPADEIALLFDGVEEPFGDEKVVGRHDRVDAAVQNACELALAGHALVGVEPSACDVFADARI